MRLCYYRFPSGTDEETLLSHGCAVILKSGDTVYVDSIPDDKRPLVDYVDTLVEGLSVKSVKELIREYGGSGWTTHIDRDGRVFDTTEIRIGANNSRFKYNHHL